MKKVFLSVSILGFSLLGFSQQETGTVTKSESSTMKIYRMEPTGKTSTELSREEEVKQCKDHLAALDSKEAWIRSNPEELKVAEETGWFEDAAETRAKLHARLKELGAE